MSVGTISELWRYPVKSMAGERLDSVAVDSDGIDSDRCWALRDVETGKIISAKRPARWAHLLDWVPRLVDGTVEVTTPAGDSVRFDDPAAASLLSDWAGHPVEVAAADANDEVYASEWPEIDGLVLAGEIDFPVAMDTDSNSFVDLATLHLLTTSAMSTLGGWIGDGVADVRRFRPSMVIATEGDGIPEEAWSGHVLRIGEQLRVRVGDPTPRCIMTTVAQGDLPGRPDVLGALAEHNRHDVGGFGYFACLGVYAEVLDAGEVSVGDEVVIASDESVA